MKRILYLAILFTVFATGCKKEQKFCWKCAMVKLNNKGYLNTANPILSTECDKTEKEIKELEKTNTKTVQVFNGNNYQTNTIQSMNCKLDQ